MLPAVINKLPEAIRNLIKSGYYTLYRSKVGKKEFFVEVKHNFGFLMDDNGKILKEATLDGDLFEQIIHYDVSNFFKKKSQRSKSAADAHKVSQKEGEKK